MTAADPLYGSLPEGEEGKLLVTRTLFIHALEDAKGSTAVLHCPQEVAHSSRRRNRYPARR